jgi:putative restriction endonuclease
MAKVVLTAAENSAYKDQIECWYHFPKTYLSQVQQALGDLIVYYEPRRNDGPTSTGGRQAYFAIARLVGIRADPDLADHYYADLADYLEFDRVVPFNEGTPYYESMLQKQDGSTNKGAFGRSVRVLPDNEFSLIVQAGYATELEPWEQKSLRVAEQVPEYVVRSILQQVVARPFRDAAFRRHVRAAYSNTCAVTGLRLINGGGRPEVQAAHIRPVEANGPDTVRNGIALTGTVHWLFDRGLMSFDDNYNVLLSPSGIPDDLDKVIRSERTLLLPEQPEWRPHATYLKWHRDNCFKS